MWVSGVSKGGWDEIRECRCVLTEEGGAIMISPQGLRKEEDIQDHKKRESRAESV